MYFVTIAITIRFESTYTLQFKIQFSFLETLSMAGPMTNVNIAPNEANGKHSRILNDKRPYLLICLCSLFSWVNKTQFARAQMHQ